MTRALLHTSFYTAKARSATAELEVKSLLCRPEARMEDLKVPPTYLSLDTTCVEAAVYLSFTRPTEDPHTRKPDAHNYTSIVQHLQHSHQFFFKSCVYTTTRSSQESASRDAASLCDFLHRSHTRSWSSSPQ